jgi:hypothetical protein
VSPHSVPGFFWKLIWDPTASENAYCTIYYGLNPGDERRARIINPVEKITVAAGIEPLTSR